MTDPSDPSAEPERSALDRSLTAVARRLDVAARSEPASRQVVLHAIIDSLATVLGAQAASLALHDPGQDRLVFTVSAGRHGAGVIGLDIGTGDGIAGYVFSTGQPLAVADATTDPRFDRATAEATGFVPRSLLAVPLTDEEGTIGVLEVLDRANGETFSLRDLELASAFARQATATVRATRLERDGASLLRDVLIAVVGSAGPGAGDDVDGPTLDDAAIERLVARTSDALTRSADDPIWRLADRISRLRDVDPGSVDLAIGWLDVLLEHHGRRGDERL